MTIEKEDKFFDTGIAVIFFRFWRKLVKVKVFFFEPAKPVFLHMQLKTTSLLKGLLKEKFEVNPFYVLEIHSQLCLRPQPWAN